MVCGYSPYTWTVLLGMIVTGAARSIVVKCTFQSGLEAPLTVTLFYLLGQSLSLVVYGLQRWLDSGDYEALVSALREDHLDDGEGHATTIELGACSASSGDKQLHHDETTEKRSDEYPEMREEDDLTTNCTGSPSASRASSPSSSISSSSSTSLSTAMAEFYAAARASFYDGEMPNGSNHGLSIQSEERIKWVHRVPFYCRPAIPAVLNLLNSALRWASLVYIDASVAEMLISGLELTLSVVAGRIIRNRMVSKSRWMGVAIVAIGVIIIERANNSKHQRSDDAGTDNSNGNAHGAQDVTIGVILIVLQSILSVLQDIGEEIFMQTANFPPTLMLGLEGAFAFCLFFIVYVAIGNQLGVENVDATISLLREETKLRWLVVGLPFLFLVTGIFNIKATAVTSAMTRNVWKNLRTVLVWATALAIFYLGHNSAYGEAWHPESFGILLGFSVMLCGIVAYYWHKEQEQSERVDTQTK